MKRSRAPGIYGWLALALTLTQGVALNAETAKGKKRDDLGIGGEYRTLNDHRFLAPLHAPDAFLNSAFKFGQGMGVFFQTWKENGGEKKSGALLTLDQTFYGQFNILNWVAIEADVAGEAAVGGDAKSIEILGAITKLRAGGGVKARIVTIESIGMQIAAGVGAHYRSEATLTPGTLVEATVDSAMDILAQFPDFNVDQILNQIPSKIMNKAIRSKETFLVSPSLMIAEGIGPFGIQLSFKTDISINTKEFDHYLIPGAHMAFDIGRLTRHFPLAISAEYILQAGVTQGGMIHSVVPGLFYSGRNDLQLGAEFEYQNHSYNTEHREAYRGVFYLSYFF